MTADQDLSARLAPCQFCGGYCSEIADVSVAEYPSPKFQVQCVACGLSGPIAPSEHEAAKLWNLVHTNHLAAVQAAVAKAVEAERAEQQKRADSMVRSTRATEIEACAKIADKGNYSSDDPYSLGQAARIAAAIRSRGVAG